MTPAEMAAADTVMRRGGWLSRTPSAFQDAVLARCLWSRVDGRTALTHGGDREGGMYGIASGAVEVTPAVGPADLPIINISQAPYWFGLMPVGLGAPRAVSITTRGLCDVAVLPQSVLTALLTAHPEWWQLLTAQALEHFSIAAQCAADLLIPDSRRRCVAVLLRVAGHRGGDGASHDAVVSQNELAAMANMSRQTTGNLLRALAADGLVDLRYRSIVLRDVAGLQALLDA